MPISIVTTFQSSWKFRPWNRRPGSVWQWTSHQEKTPDGRSFSQQDDETAGLTGDDFKVSIMVLIWSETFLWRTHKPSDVTTISRDDWIVRSLGVSQRVVASDGKVEASLIDSRRVSMERHPGRWAEQFGIKLLKNVCMKTSKVFCFFNKGNKKQEGSWIFTKQNVSGLLKCQPKNHRLWDNGS